MIHEYAELLTIKGRNNDLEMPQRGKGRGGRPGRGGHTQGAKKDMPNPHIASPAVKALPECLTVAPTMGGIPKVIVDSLPEFTECQPFWSLLEKVMPEFAGSPSLYKKCWTGISGDLWQSLEVDPMSRFQGSVTIADKTVPVFIKRVHLLDAGNAMEGEYVWPSSGALPAPSELWKAALGKINEPLNEAYVDALFALCASKLVQSGISPHWCGCLGTFTARVDRYLYNITDEYESLRNAPWWKRNQRAGLFKLVKDESESDSKFLTEGISEIEEGDFIAVDESDAEEDKKEEMSEIDPVKSDEAPVQLTKPSLRIQRMRQDSETSDEYSSTSELEQYVEFNNFPVQVTLLERAEGTMDELLDDEDPDDDALSSTKEERWTAWLFQVIAALTCAQHYYGFVHNDLHTNNILWTGTGITHLYYRVIKNNEEKIMKVPTYGRIMKIIDFGRATYTLPDPVGFVISDAFFPGNDAGTQYNCDPFFDKDEKRVEPNTSFDLSRLAVSLLEALYHDTPETVKPARVMNKEGNKIYLATVSEVYNLIWSWLIDDEGKNVLRKPDGDERYPDFDLYRALASSVHKAVPKKQIDLPIFNKYKVQEKAFTPEGPVYDLYVQ